jgi:hypothetical protein
MTRKRRWLNLDAPKANAAVDLDEAPVADVATVTEAPCAPVEAVSSPVAVAIGELLSFPRRLISALPSPTTLVCRRRAGGVAVITTSRTAFEAYRAEHVATFTGIELAALSLAAEHDRGSPAAFEAWCARKADDSAWTLSAPDAIGAAVGRFEPIGWLLGEVLRRYGLELIDVGFDNEVPSVRGYA